MLKKKKGIPKHFLIMVLNPLLDAIQTLNRQNFKPTHFVNCKTAIVYMLICDCSSFYVGKTKLKLWRCTDKNIQSMKMGNLDLPVGHHVANVHNGLPKCEGAGSGKHQFKR